MRKVINILKKKNPLIMVFISVNIIAILGLLGAQLIKNRIIIEYKTNCEKILLTNDSFGISSSASELNHLNLDESEVIEFKGEIPLSSKIVSLSVCEHGFLEVQQIGISYGDEYVKFNNNEITYTSCINCKFENFNTKLRIISEGNNSKADIGIRENMLGFWKYIYLSVRFLPYMLLMIYPPFMLVTFGNYSRVFRIKYIGAMATASAFFYFIGKLRNLVGSGPIGPHKIIGNHHYYNRSTPFDLVSLLLLLGILSIVFYIGTDNEKRDDKNK